MRLEAGEQLQTFLRAGVARVESVQVPEGLCGIRPPRLPQGPLPLVPEQGAACLLKRCGNALPVWIGGQRLFVGGDGACLVSDPAECIAEQGQGAGIVRLLRQELLQQRHGLMVLLPGQQRPCLGAGKQRISRQMAPQFGQQRQQGLPAPQILHGVHEQMGQVGRVQTERIQRGGEQGG